MSPAAQPDRPTFEVTVAGAALSPADAADVIEFDVHEEVGRHGRCTLLVQNWNADERTVRHSDTGPFAPGKDIAVALGYHSDLTPVFGGVIASITAHFGSNGRPVLRVEARSKSILLEHPPRSRQLADVTDADVASAIASDYSLSSDADSGVQRAFVVSDRQSDWDFLKARAARLGWALYVRDDTIVFHAPPGPDSPPKFDYTSGIIEAHLTEDLTHAIDTATGVSWDVSALDVAESEQSADSAGIATGDRDTHAKAVGAAGWPLRAERDEKDADSASDGADARALGRQRDAALAHVHGHMVVAGDPSLRCDAWVEITGVGARLSGPHYVTAARHRLSDKGYRTELQLGRPPVLTPPPASGSMQTGLALGVVEALDDPDSLNRVKVRLPWRQDAGEGVWARVAAADAGDGYGHVVIPNVGQEVLIGFVDGDAAAPVVLGQLFNGKAAAPVTIDPDKNAVRAFVTPGGHTVTLDDGDDAAVSIVSAKGHSVVIDDANSAVTLTHKDSSNELKLSDSGIELTAAKGDLILKASSGTVKIDAMTFEGKASAPSKFEASATFDLKASGPLGLKGALVNIN
ncbi:phage baseplate assembly protein V [Demequina sp.]|uniref:phage baseplate assembly protein V n=1 Tax=Demequina sp. TaxID=2050685 RepID=UPI003D0ABF59